MSSEVVCPSPDRPLQVVKASKEVVFSQGLCSERPPVPALALVHLRRVLLPVGGHSWPVDFFDKGKRISGCLQ